MIQETTSGPGPLIWVIIIGAIISGFLWGWMAMFAAITIITISLLLIAKYLETSNRQNQLKIHQRHNDEFKAKYGYDLPPLTDEMQEVFDRMLGISPPKSNINTRSSDKTHIPDRLIPPTGATLRIEDALSDMNIAINERGSQTEKLKIFITRCFENAIYCSPQEWGKQQAYDATTLHFSRSLSESGLSKIKHIAGEAVLLGYRTATPLDLEVFLGMKKDNSWEKELDNLIRSAIEGTGRS